MQTMLEDYYEETSLDPHAGKAAEFVLHKQ